MTTNSGVEVHIIPKESLHGAMDYAAYRAKIDDLFSQNLVTGLEQRPDLLNYTKMNIQRMNRWDKHFTPSPEMTEAMAKITKPQTWIMITEGWCGDSAQIIPAVIKIAGQNPLITTKLFFRDEHPEIMNQFLTDGKRSIPIIAALDDQNRVLWRWGARPVEGQQIIDDAKRTGEDMHLAKEKLQLWYARNKQEALMKEFTALAEQTA
jgi:hypothetical protein